MATAEIASPMGGQAQLSAEKVEEILRQPNGPYVLLDLCRDGLVDPETASRAIERVRNTPAEVLKRCLVALVEAVFAK